MNIAYEIGNNAICECLIHYKETEFLESPYSPYALSSIHSSVFNDSRKHLTKMNSFNTVVDPATPFTVNSLQSTTETLPNNNINHVENNSNADEEIATKITDNREFMDCNHQNGEVVINQQNNNHNNNYDECNNHQQQQSIKVDTYDGRGHLPFITVNHDEEDDDYRIGIIELSTNNSVVSQLTDFTRNHSSSDGASTIQTNTHVSSDAADPLKRRKQKSIGKKVRTAARKVVRFVTGTNTGHHHENTNQL